MTSHQHLLKLTSRAEAKLDGLARRNSILYFVPLCLSTAQLPIKGMFLGVSLYSKILSHLIIE